MKHYSEAAVERMMKVQEVILRAMAGKIRWWEAAQILGVSDRTMRRWRWRYQQQGYDGLYDRPKGKPSPKRVPVETVERVLGLYQQELPPEGPKLYRSARLTRTSRSASASPPTRQGFPAARFTRP